jgi:hypothetical protein
MKYAFEKLGTSVLMYPEASYTFDGTATPLPETLGKCLKLFKVPVVMVRTYGAFARDPLYNNLQKRKVDISADIKYLLSPEDIQQKPVEELNDILKREFTFDNWEWQKQNNVRIKIIRIFNTYGPNMHPNDGRVVSNFIVQALQDKPITIYGDGSQTRSFCYVDDLIEGFVRMMNQDKIIGPVNIGNPGEFTMLELAKEVLDLTGSKSKIVYKPLPGDDPKMRRPDISLAKEALGWEPTIPLRKGLEKTIVYFDSLLKSK